MNQKLYVLIKKAQGNRTQNAFALKCGIDSSTLTRILNGQNTPKPIILKKIAENACNNVTYNDLMIAAGHIENTFSNYAQPITNYAITKLPIIGTITAGYNGTACQEDLGEIEVLDIALNGYAPEDCFVLKIKGNSMYPQFIDGDLVLVHKQNHVDSGTIAVVLYNGDEATVKKVIYKYGENWLDLVPTNPEYMTKHIENEDLEQCHVIGKVISLVLRKI